MILSHKFKLIFLKTKKAGGTSFEIALSRFLGEDDINTPVKPDEELRKQLGYKTASNYKQTSRSGYKVEGHPNQNIRGNFWGHIFAKQVCANIGRGLYDEYTKIAIHRDPLDFLISWYFWQCRDKSEDTRPQFSDFIGKNLPWILENYEIAPIKGEYAVDRVIRYENLETDIKSIEQLPADFYETFKALNAKSGARPDDTRDPKEFFRQNRVENLIDYIYKAVEIYK